MKTQVERVTEYLAAKPGTRYVTENIARTRFGIQNLRSVMTKVRTRVAQWTSAQWNIETLPSKTGTAKYVLTKD